MTLGKMPLRIQKIIFWASLVLNGVLITFLLIGPHRLMPPPPPPSPLDFMEKIAKDLNGADRKIFEKLVEKHSPLWEGYGARMEEAFMRIDASVKQTPYDAQMLDKAQANLGAVRQEMDQAISAFMSDLVGAVSQEGREKLKLLPPHLRKDRK